VQVAGSERQGGVVDEEQERPEPSAGGVTVVGARGGDARRPDGRTPDGTGGAQAGTGRVPDPSRRDGPVEARVQDGKRAAVAQGVLSGRSGVRADQVPVDCADERQRRRQWRPVPERVQLGGGAEQEPETRRVGHPTVQAQTGGVRRPAVSGGRPAAARRSG